MSVPAVNQKEYLKKYLSLGTDEKRKKKRKKGIKAERVQIVDDDIDLRNMQPLDDSDFNLYELAEDAPQIAGIVDERPEELKALEVFRSSKWKIIQDEYGIEDIKVKEEKVAVTKKPTSDGESVPMISNIIDEKYDRNMIEKNARSRSEGGKYSKGDSDDSDVSPPRKSRPPADSDESPPRISRDHRKSPKRNSRGMYNDSNKRKDFSPPRKPKNDLSGKNKSNAYDSDVSPPKKSRPKERSYESPPRKSRTNYDSDVSPPRKSRIKKHSYESPPRKSRLRADSDSSPPRKPRAEADSDESPPRRSRFNADSDESPPRKRRQKEDSEDSRGRSRNVSKQPPSRYKHEQQQRSGQTRHRDQNDSDQSPPRKSEGYKRTKPSRWSNRDDEGETSAKYDVKNNKGSDVNRVGKQEKTLEGKKAGLQDSKALRMENMEHSLREKEIFSKMSDEVSGRNAVTVVRDRATGKKRDIARETEEKAAEREKENEKKEKYSKWGKGLKQVENMQSQLAEDLYEMSKPLARYADDEDLEKHLKEQEREGDPMQEYVRNTKIKNDKDKKGKGEETKKLPVYQGPQPPPNRFGIRPGYRWDGVDRSTGYEQKWFEEQNARKAVQEEAYKWSTEDM